MLKYFVLTFVLLWQMTSMASMVQSTETWKTPVWDKADSLSRSGNHTEALTIQRKLLDKAIENNDSIRMAHATHCLGRFYSRCNRYSQAIEKYFEAQHLFRKLNDSLWVAHEYNDIAYAYLFWEDYPNTIRYHRKANNIYSALKNETEIALSEANLGFTYNFWGKADSAMKHHHKALKIYKKRNDTANFSKMYHGLGYAHYLDNQFEKALMYYDSSFQFHGWSANPHQKTDDLVMMAKVFVEQKQFPKAKSALQAAFSGLKKTNSAKWLKHYYQTKYDLHLKENAFREALKAYHNLKRITDSVFNKKYQGEIRALQIKYETIENEKRIAILETENIIEKNKARLNRVLFLSALFIAILLFILSILIYRENQKKQEAYQILYDKSKSLIEQQKKMEKQKTATPSNTSRSKISEEQYSLLKEQLEQLMQTKKLYLKHGLKLSDVSSRLKTNPSYLSETINQAFGKNFTIYINEYRIREILIGMHNGKYHHLNMDGIADKAGFNSRVTFTNAFKKFTGMPPSVYLDKLQNDTNENNI